MRPMCEAVIYMSCVMGWISTYHTPNYGLLIWVQLGNTRPDYSSDFHVARYLRALTTVTSTPYIWKYG